MAIIYTAVLLYSVTGLVHEGYGHVLWLALPGVSVFAGQLLLVRAGAERGHLLVEIAACGALCLAAPAALWVGRGELHASGWWLWALTWAQYAAAIVHTHQRLGQRSQTPLLPVMDRLRRGAPALLFTAVNLTAVYAASLAGFVPAWVCLPFALLWLEALWGALCPAAGLRPREIGMRQLAVLALATLLFIVTWCL